MTVYAPRKGPFDRVSNPRAFEIATPLADVNGGRSQALTLGQARTSLAEIVRDSYGDLLPVPQLRASWELRKQGIDAQYQPADRVIVIAAEVLGNAARCVEVLAHEAAHAAADVLDGDAPAHEDDHTEAFKRHHLLTSTGRKYKPAERTITASAPVVAEPPRPFTRGTRSWRFHGWVDCQGVNCDRHGQLSGDDAERMRSLYGITTRTTRGMIGLR